MPSLNRNLKVASLCGLLAMGMVGLSYAAVPLYRLFCQVTGYAGTTQRADAAPGRSGEREITIEFDANAAPGLAWTFAPAQRRMTVKLGEQTLAFYRAENVTDAAASGQAVFNVTPGVAGRYFTKIECFCFSEQTLQARQSADMPVLFFVDPELAADPDLKSVKTITLSYTFFPVAPEKQSSAPGNGGGSERLKTARPPGRS